MKYFKCHFKTKFQHKYRNFIFLIESVYGLQFPFQVCHGSGKTTEESQTDAASRALLLIADTGLENGNCVENDDGATKEEVTVATNPPKSSAKSKTTSKSQIDVNF